MRFEGDFFIGTGGTCFSQGADFCRERTDGLDAEDLAGEDFDAEDLAGEDFDAEDLDRDDFDAEDLDVED